MTDASPPKGSGGDGAVTIMVLPDDGAASRTYRITARRRRRLRWAGGVLGAVALTFLASWGWLAFRVSQVDDLRAQLDSASVRDARVAELARELEEVEVAYENLRALFGPATSGDSGELWLPPPGAAANRSGDGSAGPADLPTSWPLTESGFLTQNLLEGADRAHPGIDVAVPAGSYVRAAGAGTVLEHGDDLVYGRYLVLQHGEGYRSRYAHNSVILADTGTTVRRGEVIALSGSTGRSTAPHLHFEILRGDSLVDPLTLVSQP